MKQLRIAIIGAGTAGLATANFLSQQSHHISIFEQVTKLAPVGAGLLLQPSGLHIFHKLGLLEQVCEWGSPVSGLVGKLPSGKRIVNSFYKDTGFNQCGIGIHRAALCHVLAEPLQKFPIQWYMGCQVSSVIQQGSEAILSFYENTPNQESAFHTAAFDLVLICNGAKSTLRPIEWTMLDKPYPWGALWAIVPECQILDTHILHQFYDSASVMMGILPTGKIPYQSPNQAISQTLSSVFWSLPAEDMVKMATEQKTEYIIDKTEQRWPLIADWLCTLPKETNWLAANYRDVVMNQYGSGSIGVIGDAAHAMSPQLGQGANMALLDAWSISRSISGSQDLTEVWQRYHESRVPSIQFYQRMSRLLTPFYQSHSKGLGLFRDISFNLMYQFPWLRKQMALTVSGVKTGPLSEMNINLSETNK